MFPSGNTTAGYSYGNHPIKKINLHIHFILGQYLLQENVLLILIRLDFEGSYSQQMLYYDFISFFAIGKYQIIQQINEPS